MTNPTPPTYDHPVVSVMGRSGKIAQVSFRSAGVLDVHYEDDPNPISMTFLETGIDSGEYHVKHPGEPIPGVAMVWDLLVEGL
jgi:hypothetical protein